MCGARRNSPELAHVATLLEHEARIVGAPTSYSGLLASLKVRTTAAPRLTQNNISAHAVQPVLKRSLVRPHGCQTVMQQRAGRLTNPPPPPPAPCTDRTRLVAPPVLIGHAASASTHRSPQICCGLTDSPNVRAGVRAARAAQRLQLRAEWPLSALRALLEAPGVDRALVAAFFRLPDGAAPDTIPETEDTGAIEAAVRWEEDIRVPQGVVDPGAQAAAWWKRCVLRPAARPARPSSANKTSTRLHAWLADAAGQAWRAKREAPPTTLNLDQVRGRCRGTARGGGLAAAGREEAAPDRRGRCARAGRALSAVQVLSRPRCAECRRPRCGYHYSLGYVLVQHLNCIKN